MSKTLRIGILNDMADGPPGPSNIEPWLRLALDEAEAAGRIPREVEFIHGWGLGLPAGTAAAVEQAFLSLVDQQVLMIIGPAIGDNALIATPLAESLQVPTINWAGSERARGEYMFQLQVGSHEDESIFLADYLKSHGFGKVCVIYDDSVIGCRYFDFFQQAAASLGLDIVAATSLEPLAVELPDAAENTLALGAQACVYLGLGHAVLPLAKRLQEISWQGECLMNTAGIRGYAADFAQQIDSWIYVDLFSDSNKTLAALRQRRDIPASQSLAAAKGYDLGRLMTEALAIAGDYSRDGIRLALERVKCLPAAEGEEGTLLGFGYKDRGALHGRYLVLRRWINGVSHECR